MMGTLCAPTGCPAANSGSLRTSRYTYPSAMSCFASAGETRLMLAMDPPPSERVNEQPAPQLGLEPGALGRHQQAGVAHREQLLDLGRVEVNAHREPAPVHP